MNRLPRLRFGMTRISVTHHCALATRYSLLAVLVLSLNACLFVKAPEHKRQSEDAALSPQPEVEMSDELVRTQAGDLIALLPKDWVYVDTKNEISDDIIAVAANPEYTMTVVFSTIPHGTAVKDAFETEGLLGLARVAYAKHARKSAGATKLVGTYTIADLGTREFGLYAFNSGGGSMRTRCAVFTSTLGNFYEFALVPLTVSGRQIPGDAEQQKIFRSIVATIQY